MVSCADPGRFFGGLEGKKFPGELVRCACSRGRGAGTGEGGGENRVFSQILQWCVAGEFGRLKKTEQCIYKNILNNIDIS